MPSMDFKLDFVNPEGLDEKEEGINEPQTGEKLNKCNQCDFASSRASNFRAHLKTHSAEKSNKCNLCHFASSHAWSFNVHEKNQWRKVMPMQSVQHLKTHSGEKSNKCN